MFTSATAANRVVTSGLNVTYDAISYTVTGEGGQEFTWYKCTRRATKEYKFVDMTRNAAEAAVTSKMDKYTRNVKRVLSFASYVIYPALSATVEAERNDCGSFDVRVIVNEEDSVATRTIPQYSDYATLFANENARDYDEGEGHLLHIEDVHWRVDPYYHTPFVRIYREGLAWGIGVEKLQIADSENPLHWDDVSSGVSFGTFYDDSEPLTEEYYVRLVSLDGSLTSNVVQVPLRGL